MLDLAIIANGVAAPAIGAAAVAAPHNPATWEPRDYLAFVTALTTVLALVVSYFVSSQTLNLSKSNIEKSIWQRANENELEIIQQQLDHFFGPFIQMSAINRLMSRDLRERQRDSDSFLLIEKLFDRDWLENLPIGEKAIVGEIATNAKTLREFIAEHSAMADRKIQPYLSRVSAHYRMVELAYEGKLGADPKTFVDRYVFPAQIDEVIMLEVTRLEKRREMLRASPGKAVPPIEELVIPDRLKLKDWPNPSRKPRPELNIPLVHS